MTGDSPHRCEVLIEHREMPQDAKFELKGTWCNYDINSLMDSVNIEIIHAVQIGPISSYHAHLSAYDHPGNMARGFVKRIYDHQDFTFQAVCAFGEFVQEYIDLHFQPIEYIPFEHDFLDTWLDHSKYTLKQKAKFHMLFDKFLAGKRNYSIFACGTFIKKEITETVKEARLINSRSDLYKAVVAPYIKLVEKQVYDNHFIKEKERSEVCERVKEIEKKFKFVMETDYTSFEASFQDFLMQNVELRLFRRILANNPHVLNIIEQTYHSLNYCYAKDAKYIIAGRRMSGEMWTSLCNGFTNKMLVEYMFHITKIHRDNLIYDYVVEGDDGFIGTNGIPMYEIVESLGFKLKLQLATDMNELSFCGLNLGPHGLYPDFVRQIRKFGYSFDSQMVYWRRTGQHHTKKYTKKKNELIKAKAYSFLMSSPPMPIMSKLCEKILQITRRYKIRKSDIIKYLSWRDHFDPSFKIPKYTDFKFEVDLETRIYFEKRFGVTVDEQIKIENEIDNQDSLDFKINLSL